MFKKLKYKTEFCTFMIVVMVLSSIGGNMNTVSGAAKVYSRATTNLKNAVRKNSDTVGWLRIAGTRINYPVVQKKSTNNYYLKRGFNKRPALSGAIFADRLVNMDNGKNIVLYGHNMKNRSMFGDLVQYKKRAFFNKRRTITLETRKGKQTYRVFSVYVLNANREGMQVGFKNTASFNKFVSKIQRRSKFKCAVPKNTKKVLTLITCSYEMGNARTVVHAYPVR